MRGLKLGRPNDNLFVIEPYVEGRAPTMRGLNLVAGVIATVVTVVRGGLARVGGLTLDRRDHARGDANSQTESFTNFLLTRARTGAYSVLTDTK
jgi:hypothetical protein